LIKNPELFDGESPTVTDKGCGCIVAHLKKEFGINLLFDLMNLFPEHQDWIQKTFFDGVHIENRDNPAWAIDILNKKINSINN